ncbi:MAG: hypothetical protein OXR66_02730 [Candidatus Woesearchaeota archaeon]|nr:hypothetical protein [Candidatus Woesearchaeota archaeon]
MKGTPISEQHVSDLERTLTPEQQAQAEYDQGIEGHSRTFIMTKHGTAQLYRREQYPQDFGNGLEWYECIMFALPTKTGYKALLLHEALAMEEAYMRQPTAEQRSAA